MGCRCCDPCWSGLSRPISATISGATDAYDSWINGTHSVPTYGLFTSSTERGFGTTTAPQRAGYAPQFCSAVTSASDPTLPNGDTGTLRVYWYFGDQPATLTTSSASWGFSQKPHVRYAGETQSRRINCLVWLLLSDFDFSRSRTRVEEFTALVPTPARDYTGTLTLGQYRSPAYDGDANYPHIDPGFMTATTNNYSVSVTF